MMKGFKPRRFVGFYNNSGKVIMIAFACHLQRYVALVLCKSPACILLAVYIERQYNRPQMTLAPGHN